MTNKLNLVKFNNTNLKMLGIIALSVALAVLIPLSYAGSAHALTKYENCIINAANNHGKLSLSDVLNCYDNEFKGAHGSDANGHPL